jgi:hypothetical protein
MATLRVPALDWGPDESGDSYETKLKNELGSMTNPKGQRCTVIQEGTGDSGLDIEVHVPKGYKTTGTTKLILGGYLDGDPAATTLAIRAIRLANTIGDSADQAYGSEQTASNATWTLIGDKDYYELAITLTAADYAEDDSVLMQAGINIDTNTYTGKWCITKVLLEYDDA